MYKQNIYFWYKNTFNPTFFNENYRRRDKKQIFTYKMSRVFV